MANHRGYQSLAPYGDSRQPLFETRVIAGRLVEMPARENTRTGWEHGHSILPPIGGGVSAAVSSSSTFTTASYSTSSPLASSMSPTQQAQRQAAMDLHRALSRDPFSRDA